METEPRKAPCGGMAKPNFSTHCTFMASWHCSCGWNAAADFHEQAWELLTKAHEIRKEASHVLGGSVYFTEPARDSR